MSQSCKRMNRKVYPYARFLGELESRGIRVRMDGKGRFLDTVFIERAYAAVIRHNRKKTF